MSIEDDYLDHNRVLWNTWTAGHVGSEFYDVASFLQGRNSLTEIELDFLGDVQGKRVLHLQCHFGQDSISMSRLGAEVTGIDLSDRAIEEATKLAEQAGSTARFIQCDVYSLPSLLNEQFDVVFTSFGTIGWLPDIDRWASVVKHFIKPGGRFVFAEFHPVVWMFDKGMDKIIYRYFNDAVIVEEENGSYASVQDGTLKSVTWNHGLAEVVNALLKQGLELRRMEEYDFSPHNCFPNTIEVGPRQFRIAHLDKLIPMTYALEARLPA
jgi:2-polyprenyl-3-methyl-5-hydroxy-6-metoxy-1,4-benzoquinol methylase